MRNIAKPDRCSCDRNAPKPKAEGSSWLAKLFGR